MKKRASSTGFTLIELMIVVAIISILASIAIPNYRAYALRAKVTDGILAAANAKVAVSEYYFIQGRLPPGGDNTAAGIDPNSSSPYIDSIDWHTDQRIEIEFDETALGLVDQLEVQLDPEIVNGILTWRCGHDTNTADEYLQYFPANCQQRYW